MSGSTNMRFFDTSKIQQSEQKIHSATKDIRALYDPSRGFDLPTLTSLTTYKDPQQGFKDVKEFEALLYEAMAHGASDIFIHADKPITMLKDLDLFALTHRPINRDEVRTILSFIAGDQASLILNKNKQLNKAWRILEKDGSGREIRHNFRVNASQTTWKGSSDTFQIVLRTISPEPPEYSKIGLTEEFVRLTLPYNGLYIIAGVTGSGKSTTLASKLRYILEHDTHIKGNILTHNEPIEYEYDSIKSTHSIIHQSEIPTNFASFYDANREAMRRRPAAAEIGELRDKETIGSALELSMTGHPVFATVHATTVDKIVDRMLKRFEVEEHLQVASDLIGSAYTFIAQRLIKDVDGKVFAVREHLVFSPEIKEAILNLDSHHEQQRYIQTLMRDSDGSDPCISKSFRKQGKELFDSGRIDQAYYNKLLY